VSGTAGRFPGFFANDNRFASHEEGNLLGHDDMKKKLQLVVELSKRLW
jgi:hypothetical protein